MRQPQSLWEEMNINMQWEFSDNEFFSSKIEKNKAYNAEIGWSHTTYRTCKLFQQSLTAQWASCGIASAAHSNIFPKFSKNSEQCEFGTDFLVYLYIGDAGRIVNTQLSALIKIIHADDSECGKWNRYLCLNVCRKTNFV